jgi:hypothetical protein
MAPEQSTVHGDVLFPVAAVFLCLSNAFSYTEEGLFSSERWMNSFRQFRHDLLVFVYGQHEWESGGIFASNTRYLRWPDRCVLYMVSVKMLLAVALQCGFTIGGIEQVLGTAQGHPVVIWVLRTTRGRPFSSVWILMTSFKLWSPS